MSDLLRTANQIEYFGGCLTVHLVEVGAVLRQQQSSSLAPFPQKPQWHAHLADVPAGTPVFLVANEFFDALPIHQYQKMADGWREQVVDLDGTSEALILRWSDERAADLSDEPPAQDGAIVERRPAAMHIVDIIAQRIATDGGAALIVDYGYLGPATGDTLQALRGHAFADPLAGLGETDLTAHVDFTPLAKQAARSGARPWGPVDQGKFLNQLGLDERVRTLCAGQPPSVARSVASAADRLTGPDQMGTLFKAMAITAHDGPAPAAFQ